MKSLNLVYPEKSDITFKKQSFPDGQQNIVLDEIEFPFVNGVDIQIKSRLNNWMDLELISCAVACLRQEELKREVSVNIHLYSPYILGARSDRKFEDGGNNYLKDVICPVINSLNFKSVTCIDPHSDVLEACIKGFKKEDNELLVSWAIGQNICKGEGFENTLKNCILVSPDAGASKKIYKLAEQIGYKGKIYTATKNRDANGKLSKQSIPDYHNDRFEHMNKDVIIVDDIGDGCNTFINLAKLIKEKRHQECRGKTYLILTHGIFSNGFEDLFMYFDNIFCTNSYSDVKMKEGSNGEGFVKQVNVF